MSSSSPSPRIKIRCPNCQKDGSARAELVNRRVSCKHCSHTFRAIAVDVEATPAIPAGIATSPDAPPPGAASPDSRMKIEALEIEIRQLRDDLSAEHAAGGEAATLRKELAGALEAGRKAEAGEQSLHKEIQDLRDQLDRAITAGGNEGRNDLREQELRFLRDQLDRSRSEVEAEARKRREATAALAARTAEHVQSLAAKEAGQAQALTSKEAEHGEGLRTLREQLEQVRSEARAAEARRLEADSARAEVEGRSADADRALRAELEQARAGLETLGLDRDRALAEQAHLVEGLRGQLAQFESKLGEAEGTRDHRDQLAQELETHRGRLAEAERLVAEAGDAAEAARGDRQRLDAAHAAEVAELREKLRHAGGASANADAIRRERDEAIIQRDRFAEELDALQARLAEAERLSADWNYSSTELEVPHAVPPSEASGERSAVEPESATLYDGNEGIRAEFETLRAELTRAADLLRRRDEELAAPTLERDQSPATDREAALVEAQQARAEVEGLRRELAQARTMVAATSQTNEELADRIRKLGAIPAPTTVADSATIDPASIEAGRRRAVDEAVKGAWADFERRLSETQAKLKAANARADLMEAEARESREQFAARERGLDLGDGSSFDEAASMTSIRILSDRGTARLTLGDAEARLGLARQTAVDRKDKALIDRISRMAEKVRDDLEARNYTLAETLVRGAEIETGLDPGGFSINGLRIFRASPTIVGSLTALAPAFDWVMRQGDLAMIRSTLEEMRTILGDQAGLPEIRRLGRTPAVKRPILEADALRLFLGALEGENWLIRPIATKKPLPDTSLTTYACLVEACGAARASAEEHAPDRVAFLDGVIQAACAMLVRRQQADGHFAFLDPRGKASPTATLVDKMVAQHPEAVKDGWVIHVDPIGTAQIETAACALALTAAGKATGRTDWAKATQRAADWAAGQPCLPNFVANAASIGLLAHAYLDARQDRHLVGFTRKLTLGLLPGQVENGRWIDPISATTPNHLAIIRALQDAWEATPADRDDFRRDLKGSLDLAMASLFAESKCLGVPPQGNALRALIRHRDLFPGEVEPRLHPAILDSATVIQELCHDGPRPKLGVNPDQLSALMRA